MKSLSIAITLVLCAFSSQMFSQSKSDAIVGVWNTGDEKNVAIVKSNNHYVGNPIDNKGNKYTKVKVLDLVYKDGKWVGKIHSKENDKYYDVECVVKGNELLLEVSVGWLSKDFEWTRLK